MAADSHLPAGYADADAVGERPVVHGAVDHPAVDLVVERVGD
jgi:hypothetical protein